MKKIFLAFMLAIVSIAASNAQSAQNDEYESLLNQALAEQNIEETMAKMLNDNLQSLVQNGTLTSAKCMEMSNEIAKEFTPDVENAVKKIWRENLSLEELRQVVKWMTSPVGKKLIGLQVSANGEMQKLMTSPAMQQKMMGIVMRYIQN